MFAHELSYWGKAMLKVFQSEWSDLRLTYDDRMTILEDYLEAQDEDEGCSLEEYASRIGEGNLSAYLATLRAKP